MLEALIYAEMNQRFISKIWFFDEGHSSIWVKNRIVTVDFKGGKIRRMFGISDASQQILGLFVQKNSKESKKESGGAKGIRTPGLNVANVPLSQLSYSPTFF